MQTVLRRKWSRADTLAEMIRAVNSSLDPERVAEAVLEHAAEWVPAPGWLLMATEDGGAGG